MDYEGMPTDLSDSANQELDEQVRPISPVSTTPSHGPLGHMWSNRPSMDMNRPSNAKGDMPHAAALMAPSLQPSPKRSREPLAMNPPTPVRAEYDMNDENYYAVQHMAADPVSSPVRPVLSATNGNSRPSSFVGSGTKSRFYGDLRASMGSRGGEKYDMTNDVTEIYPDSDEDRFDIAGNGVDRSQTTKSAQSASDYSANIEVYGSDSDDDAQAPPPRHQYSQRNPYRNGLSLQPPSNNDHYSSTPPPPMSIPRKPVIQQSPRQVSTGLDLHSGYAGLGAEFGQGMARRRDVSGKVAEEGRGGSHAWDVRRNGEAIEEETTPKKQFQSAGWARFKGL
jgi:hypothetical protein